MAQQTGMYIIGGSIPEIDADKIYNTSLTVSPSGALLAKHRKAHLFDIDVPGKITFKESDVLSPGNHATVFKAPELSCSIGVAICYDVRFPELAMIQAREYGASLLVFPGLNRRFALRFCLGCWPRCLAVCVGVGLWYHRAFRP